MTERIRVLIADDQALVRYGLRMVLESEPAFEVVGEAPDGAAAVALAARENPDVTLMDVRMPGMDGITATELLTAANSQSRVLVLTTYDLDEYAFGALRAGASGFLLKDTRPVELVNAIRAVHRGDAVVAPRITAKLLELAGPRLTQSQSADSVEKALAVLTAREREVFHLIGDGATNFEIAAALHLSESTVKTHVGRVLLKLGLRDRVQAVIRAYELGLAGR